MAKTKYPDSVREGFKNLRAATATIKRLYEETLSLKESLKITQDELENWKNKYHKTDKEKSILDARIKTTTLAEALKFIFSSLLAAYGINLLSNGKNMGYLWVVGSAVLYVAILYLVRAKSKD